MSSEPIRREREAQADPENTQARQQLLIEEMRHGRLAEERVWTAACLGFPLALNLFPEAPRIRIREALDHIAKDPALQRLFSVRCARHFLDRFQQARPDDKRVEAAIDGAEAFARGELEPRQREQLWSQARQAESSLRLQRWLTRDVDARIAAGLAVSCIRENAREGARDAVDGVKRLLGRRAAREWLEQAFLRLILPEAVFS